LSIGSGGDIDKQGRTYRDYFSNAHTYITSDVDQNMGTDLLLDARDMQLPDTSFDCVFCSGVLEHVDEYQAVVKEVFRVLRPKGVFLLGVPFKQPIHRAPEDYWRFTEHGLRWMLRHFQIHEIVPLGDPEFPFAYWAKAVKA
jgi:ubiquinone/menaquinone biosynthesis C-methylase UbiE